MKTTPIKIKGIKLFNQLDFAKGISNLRITESDIVEKNYGENSIIIRVIDLENKISKEICFAKGKNSKLFNIMNGYKKNDKRENVYNVGIPSSHIFWTTNYDLETGKFLSKQQEHYVSLVKMLEELCIINLQKISQINCSDKTPKEMQRIRLQKMEYLKVLKTINEINEKTKNYKTQIKANQIVAKEIWSIADDDEEIEYI